MKALQIIMLLVAAAFSGHSEAESQNPFNQITVVASDALLEHPDQIQTLHESKAMESLHDSLRYYIRRGKLRQSFQVQISVTEFLLVWGKDSMAVEVQVSEDGQILRKFALETSTIRGDPVKRLTKSLAKRIYYRLKKL
jgi:hypothetical protein